MGRFDSADEARFRKHGWVALPAFVDQAVMDEAREALRGVYPSLDEYEASPDAYAWIRDGQFGGMKLWPLDDVRLNLLPLHTDFVTVAERLIGTTDLRLVRAGYQLKIAGAANYDQKLHCDYGTHSLVVPDDDEIVGFFLYLSDVTSDLGPPHLVSDSVRGDLVPATTHPDEQLWRRLADSEHAAVGPTGTLLAYRATTFHRGTAMNAARGARLTLAFAYARPRPWTAFQAWPRSAERPGLVAFVARATPRQRELIGFPPVGDRYWTARTVALVERRYPGIDMTPYRR